MNFQKQTLRPLFFLFLLMCLLSGLVGVVYTPVQAAPTSILISQVYGAGGNGGAIYQNDYIELFNPTSSAISINGWSVQYAAATGTTWQVTNLPNVSIAAGQYYLIQEAAGAGAGVPLPAPDVPTGTIAMAATAGKVALVNNTTALTTSGCPFDVSVVDFVGYGTTADCREGGVTTASNAPAPSNITADIRGSNGCTDADNNSTDFLAGAPNPRNTTSPVNICPPPTATPVPVIEVVINEVAWAGTQASTFDEWIELYNPGGTAIDLTDWRVEAADGNPSILLSGSISAGGYLLLERGIQNVTDFPGTVYSSGLLSDNGEALYLLDNTSSIIDTANSNGGAWPTVSGSPNFPSMVRTLVAPDSDFVWVTFSGTPTALDAGGNNVFGTPGSANLQLGVTPTFTPSSTPTMTLTSSPTATGTSTPTRTPTRTSTPGVCGVGTTPTSIIINEIAWAGTAASATDEWIELYNPTPLLINLNGWILKAVDNTPNIPLTNINLAPGQYYLLERTDDTTVSDATANQIFTGEIGNTNEILQLYNSSGVCVDTANSNSGGWPAGTSSPTFGSMERRGVVTDSDTAWITNVNSASWTKHDARGTGSTDYLIHGTPGYGNWAFSVTSTPSPIPSNTSAPTKFKTSTPAPTALPPPPPLIAISEFVPRPAHDWNQDGVIDVGDEYIEIINHGVIDVNLSGYSLDDEANIGSVPYRLPAVTLKPGERRVFYGKETGLLLSDGGDGVRLLKPNGQLGDAYNYTVVRYPDQAYCRLPDDGGLDPWSQNCFPTPGLKNSLSGSFVKPPTAVDDDEPLCPISDTLPIDFAWAECPSFGNMWSRFYWDAKGWFGEKSIPDLDSKWDVFVD